MADPTNDPTNEPNNDPAPELDAHAKSVIARANAEAKKHREAREAAEAQAKKTADDLAELKKKLDDREKADLEANSKFRELAEKLAIEKSELEKAHKADLEARDAALKAQRDAANAQLVKDAVSKAAVKAGIIDEDLVDLWGDDLKAIELVNGKPSKDAIDALINAKKTEKPKLFEEEREAASRNADGTFKRPDPAKKKGEIDWSALTPDEFAAKERELIRSRV